MWVRIRLTFQLRTGHPPLQFSAHLCVGFVVTLLILRVFCNGG
jgi:hypothetical protein